MKMKNRIKLLVGSILLLIPCVVKADIAPPDSINNTGVNSLPIVLICIGIGIFVSLLAIIIVLIINKKKKEKTV